MSRPPKGAPSSHVKKSLDKHDRVIQYSDMWNMVRVSDRPPGSKKPSILRCLDLPRSWWLLTAFISRENFTITYDIRFRQKFTARSLIGIGLQLDTWFLDAWFMIEARLSCKNVRLQVTYTVVRSSYIVYLDSFIIKNIYSIRPSYAPTKNVWTYCTRDLGMMTNFGLSDHQIHFRLSVDALFVMRKWEMMAQLPFCRISSAMAPEQSCAPRHQK